MNKLIIRPLNENDYEQWLPLWDGNNYGERDDDVTYHTWKRISSPKNIMVRGICAEVGGEIRGIAHYIVHFTTGQVNPVAYMQDVFVDPKHRRKGIGRRLVNEITEIAKREDWSRLYWLAQENNKEARAMYEHFGIKLNFTFYVLPIS